MVMLRAIIDDCVREYYITKYHVLLMFISIHLKWSPLTYAHGMQKGGEKAIGPNKRC